MPVQARTPIDLSDPFAVVLLTHDGAESLVLQSARDANAATMAFFTERRRLKRRRVIGELVVVRQDQHNRPLLREEL